MFNFIKALILGVILTQISFVVATNLGWNYEFNWLEYIAVASSYACTLLCVWQSRWNYPIGVFTTFLYSILLWQWGMPALAIFNLYLVFSLAYGYWRWGPDGKSLPVTDLKFDGWLLGYVGLGVCIYFMLIGADWFILQKELQAAPMLATDIIAAVLSGIAQFLLDNKKRQTWMVWAVVNVFSIYLFVAQGLYLVMFQYIFFLGNTIYGWISWTRSMK